MFRPARQTGSRRPVALLLLAAILSILISTQFTRILPLLGVNEKLDRYRANATTVATAAAAASAVVAAVPDDSTTPIAEQIANVSQYMIIATLALTLEKLIFGISGVFSFAILFPIACILRAGRRYHELARKLLVFGLVLLLIVPCGVAISTAVESSVGYEQKIGAVTGTDTDTEQTVTEKPSGFFERISGFFSSAISTVKDLPQYAQKLLSSFVDAVVAILITSCLIPLLIMLILWSTLKQVLGTLIYGHIPKRQPVLPHPDAAPTDDPGHSPAPEADD